MTWLSIFVTSAIASVCLFSAQAQAQAVRTWVSGVGDDANPCSLTAPCKTFAGAISKTSAGGEISVLTSGGFGSVTITKALSIVAVGADGSILGLGHERDRDQCGHQQDAISLYGLKIEGSNTGLNGIRILQAGSVYVSNTIIKRLPVRRGARHRHPGRRTGR